MIVPILILGFILVVISGLVSARRKRNYPVPKRRVCDMSVTKEGDTSLSRPVEVCQTLCGSLIPLLQIARAV